MTVDGVFSTIGSINFDSRSLNANAEESLAFYSRSLAEKIRRMFEDDRRRCEQITWEDWDTRGFPRRLSELVFWIWEPYY
jgi:cardiolipin synthase